MTTIKNQTFGIEIEFTGITRKAAAAAIAKELNGNFRYTHERGGYDKRIITDAQGRKWTICSDSSVTGSNGGNGGEFVTPICTYADIEVDGTVQRCVRALKKAGAKVDKTCGLHIHVGANQHTAKSLKNLCYTFHAKQFLIYKAVGAEDRLYNGFCTRLDTRIIDALRPLRQPSIAQIADAWYQTYAPGQRRDMHYNASRYHGLNLHSVWYHGTVEFRLFHATLHAGKVRAYVNLCLAMSAQAINATRATAEPLVNGNDKYAMRCWLLRLGFIGDEWKAVRGHLLEKLDGNAAWRNAPETYESYNNQRRRAEA